VLVQTWKGGDEAQKQKLRVYFAKLAKSTPPHAVIDLRDNPEAAAEVRWYLEEQERLRAPAARQQQNRKAFVPPPPPAVAAQT
jgi:hypothetical protein